jgi:hypothetical protein
MKTRRVISLTIMLAFIVTLYTGIMLFICPHGRIAEWTGWRMLGMSKGDYGVIHATFMIIFIVTGIWHIVLNWKQILNYMKDKSKKLTIFTPEFTLALVICVVFFAGALMGLPPFKQYIDAEENIKNYWEVRDGSPPWGHAELNSIDKFCRSMVDYQETENGIFITLDPQDALVKLQEAGIQVEGVSETLFDIAEANRTSAQALSDIIMTAAIPSEPELSGSAD